MQPKPRNPYDLSTWGRACAQGVEPKDLGTVVAGKAASRKISQGRKAYRGTASDGFARLSLETGRESR